MFEDAILDWQFKRGRQLELDRTEAGTGSIKVQNRDGLYDRTNLASPVHDDILPLVPVEISVHHPFAGTDHVLFSAYVEDWKYDRYKKLPKAETLTVPIVDGFEVLSNAKVKPGSVPGHEGGLYYAAQHVDDRIRAAAADAEWPALLTDINPGNVTVQEITYPPGTSMLEVMQDAADAEFPGVSNLFMGHTGVLAFRGRYERFTKVTDEIVDWVLGDDWGLSEDASRIPIYDYRWALEKQFIFNSVLVTPAGIDVLDIPGQRVEAAPSIDQYGRRDHDITDLLILEGDNGNTGVEECRDYAAYYVNNYKQPYVRVYELEVHSAMGEAAWDFVAGVGLGHVVELWTQHPGGGGLDGRRYFVEAINARSAGPGVESGIEEVVTVLDLSPVDRWALYG